VRAAKPIETAAECVVTGSSIRKYRDEAAEYADDRRKYSIEPAENAAEAVEYGFASFVISSGAWVRIIDEKIAVITRQKLDLNPVRIAAVKRDCGAVRTGILSSGRELSRGAAGASKEQCVKKPPNGSDGENTSPRNVIQALRARSEDADWEGCVKAAGNVPDSRLRGEVSDGPEEFRYNFPEVQEPLPPSPKSMILFRAPSPASRLQQHGAAELR
jgi:hypothetical protein